MTETAEERLEALEALLKEVAVLILSQVDPDAAGALARYEDERNAAMASNDKMHGPYCRESTIQHNGTKDGLAHGVFVYCGKPAGHRGPCEYVQGT